MESDGFNMQVGYIPDSLFTILNTRLAIRHVHTGKDNPPTATPPIPFIQTINERVYICSLSKVATLNPFLAMMQNKSRHGRAAKANN